MPNPLYPPCNVGDKVYCPIVFDGEMPCIDSWVVEGLYYDGEKWYAETPDGAFIEFGEYAMLTFYEAAEHIMQKRGVTLSDETK